MKIIMSRAVLEESHAVGSEIAQLIIPGTPVPSLDEQLNKDRVQYLALKNVHLRINADGGIEYEIDDSVVIAILRLYGKFAGVINAVVQTVKVMLPMLKADVLAINELIEERH